MTLRPAVLCGVVVLWALALSGCGGAHPLACSPENCAGCCSATGVCVDGNSNAACGASGLQCATCDSASSHCFGGACVPGGTGAGGGGTGGGSASTGGGSNGGGTATGGAGGQGTGGGTHATGGGSSGVGGGSAATCMALDVPQQTAGAIYVQGSSGETTYSQFQWQDDNGTNVLALEIQWPSGTQLSFPLTGTVTNGQTSEFVVTVLWMGCSSDLSTCANTYVIYNGSQYVSAATRGPQGSISATTGTLALQLIDSTGNFVTGGACYQIAAQDFSATYQCTDDGNSCTENSDCCGNSCSSGYCSTGPTCSNDGTACFTGTDCCNGVCSSGICGAGACQVVGTTCQSASQCCTGSCLSGLCAAPACTADGLACTSEAQCCTGSCTSGLCGAAVCGADGTSCTSGTQCCAGSCTSGLCGVAACGAQGTGCTSGAQCCSAICSSGLCGATSSCSSDGAFCTSASQCCSGACTGETCGLGSSSCDPVNDTGCSLGNDCILLSSEMTTCAIGGNETGGDSCSASSPCSGGLGCFGGTCRHLCVMATGDGCFSGQSCAGVSGWFTYGVCN